MGEAGLCPRLYKPRLESGIEKIPRSAEGTTAMTNPRFASVWNAIESSPEQAENLRLRSALMMAISRKCRAAPNFLDPHGGRAGSSPAPGALGRRIERSGWTQAQAAEVLGVTQPRVSDLLRGKINRFGLDALVNMAAAAGLHVDLQVT